MTTPVNTGSSYLDTLNTTGPTATAAAKSKSNQAIDQAGFLKLLTTQLKTQDPTQPTDSTQMVQQMATFSQVTGIAEMNQSLKGMATTLSASRFGSASGWIGRAALLASNSASQASNGAYAGQITLPANAKDVTINLVNAAGQTVYSQDLGAHAAGTMDWKWDGKDPSGKQTTDGALKVIVNATGDRSALAATSATWNEISSVQSPASGTTTLMTGLGSIAPSNVLSLS